MVMKDKIDCSYTTDGYVAMECNMLGNMYIMQAISLKTGQYWYARQFDITERFFADGAPDGRL